MAVTVKTAASERKLTTLSALRDSLTLTDDSLDAYLTRLRVTVHEAAANTGYTVQHVRFLLRQGLVNGRKFGRDWFDNVRIYSAGGS